jgi:hypothetical protein
MQSAVALFLLWYFIYKPVSFLLKAGLPHLLDPAAQPGHFLPTLLRAEVLVRGYYA